MSATRAGAGPADGDGHGVQVVARAAAILRQLGQAPRGRSLAEIASGARQRPLNVGARFSMKARGPSTASSVRNTGAPHCSSISMASRSG